MKNTHAIGNLSEVEVIRALMRKGYAVSLPFGDGARYDLIVDKDGCLLKVQCKTGKIAPDEGSVVCLCRSIDSKTGRAVPYTEDQIDAFGIYCPQNDKVYLVPIGDTPDTGFHLRLLAPRNNQTANIRWAKDYEI